jgi:hypothetical protein
MAILRSARTLGVAIVLVVVALVDLGLVVRHALGQEGRSYALEDVGALISSVKELAGTGDTGAGQRQQLAEQIAARFLSRSDEAVRISPAQWQVIVESLGRDMDEGARAVWREGLRAGYCSAALDPGGLGTIQWVLNLLGDQAQNDFAANWVKAQDCWRAWGPEGLVTLGKCLGYGWPSPGNVEQARDLVVAHLLQTRLSSSAQVKAVSPATWPDLARFYGKTADKDNRQFWAAALKQAFAPDDEALRGLSCQRAGGLVGALTQLAKEPHEGSEAAEAAAKWLRAQDPEVLSHAKPESLRPVCEAVSLSVALKDPKELVSRLETAWTAQLDAGLLDASNFHAIVAFCSRAEDNNASTKWAGKAEEALVGSDVALEKLSAEDLRYLSSLISVAQEGRSKGSSAYARAMALMARKGALDHLPDDFPSVAAFPVSNFETREIVQAEITDGKGQVRQMVAAVLSCSYVASGQADEWIAWLGARAGETADEAIKAQWALAKGYAEAVKSRRAAQEEVMAAMSRDPGE